MKNHYMFLFALAILFTTLIITISNQRVNYVKGLITSIREDQKFIISKQLIEIKTLETELQRKQIVTISFYHPKSKGINSDSDHTNTAIMRNPVVGRTVAISKDLFDLGWLDGKVYIEGYGVFIMEDRMGYDVKGKQIDICVCSKKEAFRLGVKREIVAIRLLHL